MSRQKVAEAGQALTGAWDRSVKEAAQWHEQFRQTRLHTQIWLSVALVALTWLSNAWPAGPLGRVRDGLTQVVTHQYDFRGRAGKVTDWARERGGWVPAARGVWNDGVRRVKERVRLPALPALPEFPSDPPAPAETEPVAAPAESPAVTPPATEPEPEQAPRTVMPVDGPVMYGYGWLPKGKQPHEGLDLAARAGDPVVAMAPGTVLRVATDEVVGGLVEVDHGFAIALYGQVSGVKVKAGDSVKQGQLLAAVARPTGKEGDSGVHLHLEIRPGRGAKPIDPAPYLPLNGGTDV